MAASAEAERVKLLHPPQGLPLPPAERTRGWFVDSSGLLCVGEVFVKALGGRISAKGDQRIHEGCIRGFPVWFDHLRTSGRHDPVSRQTSG